MLILRDGKIAQSGAPRKILDRPANVDVARLLGVFNLIESELRSLDPGRNTSRLQVVSLSSKVRISRRFKGDRVTICVRPIN